MFYQYGTVHSRCPLTARVITSHDTRTTWVLQEYSLCISDYPQTFCPFGSTLHCNFSYFHTLARKVKRQNSIHSQLVDSVAFRKPMVGVLTRKFDEVKRREESPHVRRGLVGSQRRSVLQDFTFHLYFLLCFLKFVFFFQKKTRALGKLPF